MAKSGDIILPDEFFYHQSHSYAKKEGELLVIGIDALGVKKIGSIEYMELPQKGAKLEQGKAFARVESAKWVGEIISPAGGEVVEVNMKASDDPEIVKKEPYNAGWLVKIRPAKIEELNLLKTGSDIQAWLDKEMSA